MVARRIWTALALPLLAAGCVTAGESPPPVPLADFHQHLVSPAFAPLAEMPVRDGAALVRELDAAGIDKAVVLSVGYSFADERKGLAEPDRLTREENDWTSAQATAQAPRLIGFCSANPLRDAALGELDRCLGLPGMAGIKIHMGNSGMSLREPAHLARMREILALAQRRQVPVLIHMRARGGANFGAEDARLFLEEAMPAAPGLEVVIAHLGATSPGYPAQNDEVMAEFGRLLARGNSSWSGIYFDPSANVTEETTPEEADLIVRRFREVGMGRILYGSDLSAPGGSIAAGWEIFRRKLPLTPAELRRIARNRPDFLR